MIFITHEKYPDSPTTTMLNQLNYFVVAICIIGTLISGIIMFGNFSVKALITFVIWLALFIFFTFIINDKILPKLAEREKQKNIRKMQAKAAKKAAKSLKKRPED